MADSVANVGAAQPASLLTSVAHAPACWRIVQSGRKRRGCAMCAVTNIRGRVIKLVLVGAGFVAGLVASPWLISDLYAQTRATTNTEILRTDLGDWCGGKQISIEVQEAGPGASGRHYHPGYSFAWIVAGSLVRTIDGQQPIASSAGDVVREDPMQISETRNAVPVKSVIFRIVEPGKPNTVAVP